MVLKQPFLQAILRPGIEHRCHDISIKSSPVEMKSPNCKTRRDCSGIFIATQINSHVFCGVRFLNMRHK